MVIHKSLLNHENEEWNYRTIRNFCLTKKIMIRVQRQPKKWENNRCQLCTRQGISIQNILKKTAKIKHHKMSCISKWASKLIRQFSKEEIQIPNKYFEKCSIPFEIPSHSSWNPTIKKTNAGKDLGIRI